MVNKIKRRSFIKTTSVFALGIGASDLLYSSFSGEQELVVIDNKKSPIPIVVPGNIPIETLSAADDLAEYIKRIGGIRPAIYTGGDSVPQHAIWIGNQPQLSEIFDGVELTYTHPEEVLIVCNGENVLIAGSDLTVNGQQLEYGTVNAIYTFAEKFLDVRWLWPGELGTDVIRKDTITLPSFIYRFHPLFLEREIFQKSASWKVSDKWACFQRLKKYSLVKGPRGGSHAFTDWWDKYHIDHPEWFALQPDGTRSGYPEPVRAKLCLSNPEVWEQWLKEVEDALKNNPKATVFNATENDSYFSGLCVCENCRAWDHPDGQVCSYDWKGHTEEYVASTNRVVTFWNILARKLKERFPDRENLYVLGLAFGAAKSAPIDMVIEKNVIISYTGAFPTIDDRLRQQEKEQIIQWTKFAPRIHYRPNLWYWTGGYWALPDMALKNVIEDFRFLADNNFIGICVDTAREHWCTQAPQYYLMAQLTWDPLRDGQAVLEDYYTRGFGKAAEKIKAYWNLMEQAREEVTASPDFAKGTAYRFKLLKNFTRVYTEDFFNSAYDLIRQAKELVAGEPEIYLQRIDFIYTGLELTRLMIDNIALMDRVRASKGGDREAVNKVVENWKTIKGLYDKAGPASFNYTDLMAGMTQNRYMAPMQDYFGPPSEKYLMTSIDVTAVDGVTIYPNPLKDKLTIFLDTDVSDVSFRLFDSMGVKLYEGRISGTEIMDMSSYPAGLYILILKIGTEVKIKKIIRN